MSTPSWELSKENVAPLARGRDKASLGTALHTSRDEVACMHAAHEAAVDAALAGEGPHAADPLAPAAAFVKWAADAYPPKATSLLRVLERSCRAFVNDARYTNDPRFVRLWVRYADVRNDPLDCFAFMRSHSIGDTSALFYEAWATTLEYKKDFRSADTAYKLGLDRNAQPRGRLEQRQREFLSRMVARDQRAEKRAAKAARGEGKTKRTPSNTRPASVRQHTEPADENVRPALGALTKRQASSGRRPVAASSTAAPGGALASSSLGVRSRAGNSSFKVFADPEAQAGFRNSSAQEDMESSLPSLAKLDEARKENEGELPSQWSGVVMPQSSPLARAREVTRQRQGRTTPFEVFLDEERKSPKPPAPDSQTRRGKWTAAGPEQHSGTTSGPSSPTINTKIANKLVEDMFNTTLPCERVENADGHIYSDFDEQGAHFRSTDSKSGPTDDCPSSVDNVQPTSSFASREERSSSDPAKGGGAKPTFEIFQDAPESSGTSLKQVSNGGADPEPFPQTGPSENCGEAAHSAPEHASREPVAMEPISVTGLSVKSKEDWYAETCIDTCPDFPCYRMMQNSCTQLSAGTVVEFQGEDAMSLQPNDNHHLPREAGRSFFVEAKLGDGAEGKSRVFSASSLDDMDGGDGDDEEELNVAIKTSESVNLLWEFYIYSVLGERVQDPRGLLSFPKVLFFYHGEPQAYLITDRVSVATLGQIAELSALEGGMSDHVGLFYLVEMLRALEVVHSVGIIHADLCLENIIIRKDGSGQWCGPYDPTGKSGWGGKGVAFIDFNNAVDTRHKLVGAWSETNSSLGQERTTPWLAHSAFIGDAHMKSEYMAGKRGSPWGFNADCYSVSVCARKLLGNRRGKAYNAVVDVVLNRLEKVAPETSARESCSIIQDSRHKLEDELIAGSQGDDGVSLRAELKAIFVMASEARQANDATRG